MPDSTNPNTNVREYQQMFDEFVYSRNLDLDDRYWSEQDKQDWKRIYSELQIKWNRPPLL